MLGKLLQEKRITLITNTVELHPSFFTQLNWQNFYYNVINSTIYMQLIASMCFSFLIFFTLQQFVVYRKPVPELEIVL